MTDVLAALQFLHSKDILHLDLKPANVPLNEDRSRARLTDFGAARLCVDGETVMTRSIYTPNYAAPEVLAGVATRAADVWSFGVVLFEVINLDPMQPAASAQLAVGRDVDLSAIANPRAGQLIARCLAPMIG